MSSIRRVAVFGASGNFGRPITAALLQANFQITIISRSSSTATFPPGVSVLKITYTTEELTHALQGQDAAVCVVGPAGISQQIAMIDAAEAAGVKRFIVDDFGWGPDMRGLPEFAEVHMQRRRQWDYARIRAEKNPGFTWTGVTIGNPIDWALSKFPTMGFDVTNSSAVIYDTGEEYFTGTTLAGIGQSVVGILQRPVETANRFVKVLSIKTCQNELLHAFEKVTGKQWEIQWSTTRAILDRGRAKHSEGNTGWVLDLVVAQLYDEGEARCVVAPTREQSDAVLLGVALEDSEQVVSKALGLRDMFT
ncbi:hypothetical protein N0V93_000363 [Gnomoniopsis smithogilvyi]|uniref:NAD(P)-binding domain-containing protein n=1 Tax=Gnomoniopsis smithogilvyi TaxID=1191159 RepID=A0A9W8Z237_9PEZI|nr:hypothetical protein N0V93_000363 [Gnomoniopsis smithogilvyi]